MPKLYLERSGEFKNGNKVEFGAKMGILGGLKHRVSNRTRAEFSSGGIAGKYIGARSEAGGAENCRTIYP